MAAMRRWSWLAAGVAAAAGCWGGPGGVSRLLSLDGWESYAAGKFGRAGSLFGAALSTNPRDPDAHAGLGRLSLQKLDLVPARQHLERALEIAPRHPQALEDLALSYHLEGRFDLAAESYARIGSGFEPLVRMMRSFGGAAPYRVSMPAEEVRIPLAAVDPLPIVEVRIAGRGPYRFYVDTGAAEVFVDARLARELGLAAFGEVPSIFPGGETKPVAVIRIPSIEVGEVRVEELPGSAMDLSAASGQAAGGYAHGILGTHFLMQFTSTIDYRGRGALVLRERNRTWNLRGARLPFVMVGDHYLLAQGTLNGVDVLWFVDTGLAGEAPIAATGSALAAAGIPVGTGKVIGQGAGGSHILRTFVAERVTVGPIVRERVAGLTDVLPGTLERRFRVRIAGMLGHGFFRRGAVTFDFREMAMRYEE